MNNNSATAHFWFGPRGVRTRPHYDMSHNFFVQVFGTKTFYLAPPRAAPWWYIYPWNHPSARHAQLDWPHTATSRFPLATQGWAGQGAGAQLMDATVGPGDVLFLPSLWIHGTESRDLSLVGGSVREAGSERERARE